MKFSTTTALSALLLGTAANAQVPCRSAPGPIPQDAPTGRYTRVLDTFRHAAVGGTTGTLDPLTRHYEITNRDARRRIWCHYYQGEICFWINSGDTCVTTLPARYVNSSVSGFVYTWYA